MSAPWDRMRSIGPAESPRMHRTKEWTPVQSARFEALYAENVDFMCRVLARMGVPAATLEDAAQEVFVAAYRRFDDFDGASPRSWLYAIAVRVASVSLRRLGRKEGRQSALPETLADERPDPFVIAAHVEAARKVDIILSALSDDQRQAFLLADVEGMTAPEIAESLGVNVNTVWSRLRAARKEFERLASRFAFITRVKESEG